MRITQALFGSFVLATTIGLVASSNAAGKHPAHRAKPSGSSASLVARGKALVISQHCNTCHGADLKGKHGFAPSLYSSTRPMTEYTEPLFVRLLTKGIDNDGKPIRPPMKSACNQTVPTSKAIYAYLKTLK